MEYDIEVRNQAGEVRMGVEGDFDSDATAINWTYYYLVRYRGRKAKLYRGGHTNPRDASTLVIEISSDAARPLRAIKIIDAPPIEIIDGTRPFSKPQTS
jgi:hypothetical protein